MPPCRRAVLVPGGQNDDNQHLVTHVQIVVTRSEDVKKDTAGEVPQNRIPLASLC